MDRRAFCRGVGGTVLGGALLVAPAGAEAQPARLVRIGFLSPARPSDPRMQNLLAAFRHGLTDLGYVEGRTFTIDARWAEDRYERLPALASELVALKVDVIVAFAVPAIRAAKEATSTIPIVMASVVDPVATGLVSGLARPGGNVTGLSNMAPDVTGKLFEIMKQVVPKASLVAVLWNPGNPGNVPQLRSAEAAGRALGLRLLALEARTPEDLPPAFAVMTRQRADALVVLTDTMLNESRVRIASLATAARLPAVYGQDGPRGGLITYSANTPDLFRRAATYVDRIAKGKNPGELPIEQATHFDLVIDLTVAKALGITIPESLLLRADRLIQ